MYKVWPDSWFVTNPGVLWIATSSKWTFFWLRTAATPCVQMELKGCRTETREVIRTNKGTADTLRVILRNDYDHVGVLVCAFHGLAVVGMDREPARVVQRNDVMINGESWMCRTFVRGWRH